MRKAATTNKFILYARKSTESDDRQVLSIESQISELRATAAMEGLKIVDVLTESRSAKTLGRPVFGGMLDRIERGEANGILCWKLDRLARNMVDGGRVINLLQMGAIRHIRSHERSYYPADNVLLMSVEFGMANQYSRDLAVNVTRGMKKKCEMGWYPVQPPLGYLNSKTSGKGQNIIYTDPERFTIVRKIWDAMLSGTLSPQEIRLRAKNEWGLRTRGGGPLGKSQILNLFRNTFYYGEFEMPRGSGIIYKGKHERMITTEEYDRVQYLLGKRGQPRPHRHTFEFVGLMKCGECGMSITAEEKTKYQKNGNIHRYTYYHCTKKSAAGCSQKTIEEKELNRQVDAELATLEIPETFHLWAMNWIKVEQEKEKLSRGPVLVSQQSAYNRAVQRIDRYIEMRVNGEITEEEFRVKKESAMKEREHFNELLNDTDNRVAAWVNKMGKAFEFVAIARERFNNGSPEQRKRIFRALGSNLMLKDQKVIFDAQGSLLPIKKIAGEIAVIHGRLEPTNMAQSADAYNNSKSLSAQRDSNPRPSP